MLSQKYLTMYTDSSATARQDQARLLRSETIRATDDRSSKEAAIRTDKESVVCIWVVCEAPHRRCDPEVLLLRLLPSCLASWQGASHLVSEVSRSVCVLLLHRSTVVKSKRRPTTRPIRRYFVHCETERQRFCCSPQSSNTMFPVVRHEHGDCCF